jgi:ribosomal-protein-alanine N-acetyltransferase
VTLPLTTPRLIVREFAPSDRESLAVVFADPAVLWWEPGPLTEEQTGAWLRDAIARRDAEGVSEYAVVERSSGAVVGYCGPELRHIEGRRLLELGWAVRSDLWGRGYATEAARGVLTHLATLGVDRVYSAVLPGNERSRAVARKLGMTVEREVVWHGGPHELWALDLA